MRTISVICMSLLLAIAPAFAQTVVKGTVTSADDGMPLIGVSVVEQGTTNGTVTDIDCNYELETTKNATIQFSYIGFKTQTAKAASVLNIIMESDAIMHILSLRSGMMQMESDIPSTYMLHTLHLLQAE